MKKTLRECYAEAKANAALEGISLDGPPELAALLEEWLSGKITSEQYREGLNTHYRKVSCGDTEPVED
ncbi:MAG: hypothetical protein KKE83_08470 [Proteobacteria bacterium]|jgi:hypothetical protein|nr:hypothetical protein [Pseudomonadota bacterium]